MEVDNGASFIPGDNILVVYLTSEHGNVAALTNTVMPCHVQHDLNESTYRLRFTTQMKTPSRECFESFEEDGYERVDITSGFFGGFDSLTKVGVRVPNPNTTIIVELSFQ